MDRKRVLQVNIDNNGGNGAYALVRYLYSFLKEEYVFDYFTMGNFIDDLEYENIITEGGKCYSSNLRKNKLIGHIKLPFVFYKFLKQNSYEIVHIHSEVAYKHFLYAIAAKKAHVKKIIIHSHSSNIDGYNKKIKYVFHKFFKSLVNKMGTDFLACSYSAAKWMFSPKVLNDKKFHVLHNGINPLKYKFSDEIRNKIRDEYGLNNYTIIGHVGALKKVKNQERLLSIINDIDKGQYKLILIGDGDDKEKLEQQVSNMGISDNVLFLGNRTNVNELLQAIDVFVFPSYFEGIPMALIEAQTVGIPIIASDKINNHIKINSNVWFCSLDDDNKKWISLIEECKKHHIKSEGFKNVCLSDFNIEKSAKVLEAVYKND